MSRCALVITLCLALGAERYSSRAYFLAATSGRGHDRGYYGSEPAATASAGAKLDFDTVCERSSTKILQLAVGNSNG